MLSGHVEVDGGWFGGYARPENKTEDRVDRRLAQNRTGKRRSVIVAREKKGRTRTLVVDQEAAGVDPIAKVIAPGSTVHADEATHWDRLHAKFQTLRINHSEAYSLGGICTNQAESVLLATEEDGRRPAPSRLGAIPSRLCGSCRLARGSSPRGQRRALPSCARAGDGTSGVAGVEGVLAEGRTWSILKSHFVISRCSASAIMTSVSDAC